jgi:aspartate/methionine/tyrosine aminotransferase
VSRLEAEGGWYACLRLPGTRGDDEWALEFLERDGVYVHPGHFFGFENGAFVIVSLIVEPDVFEAGMASVVARVASDA